VRPLLSLASIVQRAGRRQGTLTAVFIKGVICAASGFLERPRIGLRFRYPFQKLSLSRRSRRPLSAFTREMTSLQKLKISS